MIRSLTVGVPLEDASSPSMSKQTISFFESADSILNEAGRTARTKRLTLSPAGSEYEIEGSLRAICQTADRLAEASGARWICLPIDLSEPTESQIRVVESVEVLKKFPRVFLNYLVGHGDRNNVQSALSVANAIINIARLSNNGFDNFRVGCSFDSVQNGAFFPFSAHSSDELGFSLALETTDRVTKLLQRTRGNLTEQLSVIREELIDIVGSTEDIAKKIELETGIKYHGSDGSFAPFPTNGTSVAQLIHQLIGTSVGSRGTIMATAMLTNELRAAYQITQARSVGFNGVMYSVLEDDELAQEISNRSLDLDSLISYASVCGCGVDMVPLAGNSFPEEIASLILDLGAMSKGLSKPLGVRVLPIPGKVEQDFTEFNQDFLCNSRIVPLGTRSFHDFLDQAPYIFDFPLNGAK